MATHFVSPATEKNKARGNDMFVVSACGQPFLVGSPAYTTKPRRVDCDECRMNMVFEERNS